MLKSRLRLICLGVGLLLLVTGCSGASPRPDGPSDDARVQFVKPKGSRDREKARAFPVSRKMTLELKPDVEVVFQVYQDEKLVQEWKTARSGAEFELPGSGLAELKVWRAGLNLHDDAIWIWVSEKDK